MDGQTRLSVFHVLCWQSTRLAGSRDTDKDVFAGGVDNSDKEDRQLN